MELHQTEKCFDCAQSDCLTCPHNVLNDYDAYQCNLEKCLCEDCPKWNWGGKLMFKLLRRKNRPTPTTSPTVAEVAVTTMAKGRQPAQKCPFMQPLNYGDGNGSPIHLFYDCMRDQCKIWDGENCSLHRERRWFLFILEKPSKQPVARMYVKERRKYQMAKTTIMTVKGQEIRVTQHGKPDPKIVQKAYERLISNILREYEDRDRHKLTSSLVIKM